MVTAIESGVGDVGSSERGRGVVLRVMNAKTFICLALHQTQKTSRQQGYSCSLDGMGSLESSIPTLPNVDSPHIRTKNQAYVATTPHPRVGAPALAAAAARLLAHLALW